MHVTITCFGMSRDTTLQRDCGQFLELVPEKVPQTLNILVMTVLGVSPSIFATTVTGTPCAHKIVANES